MMDSPYDDLYADYGSELHQYVIRNDEVGFNRLKRHIENPNLLISAPPNNSTVAANAHLNATFGHHSSPSIPGPMNGYRGGFGGGLSNICLHLYQLVV